MQWLGQSAEFYRNVPQFNLDPNIVESTPQWAEDATAAATNVPIAEEGDLPSDDIGMQDSDTQSVVHVTETSVSSFQSQLRQTLSRITGLTYTVTNVGFMKKALDTFREHAKQFAAHSDKRQCCGLVSCDLTSYFEKLRQPSINMKPSALKNQLNTALHFITSYLSVQFYVFTLVQVRY